MAHRPKPRRPRELPNSWDGPEQPRWSGLRQQQRLQSRHHTPEQNAADRQACRALVDGGYGTDPEFVAWQQRQQQTELDLNQI